MSFGFSVSDFISVGRLITDVVATLRDSPAEYQELLRELGNLQRALQHVDKLKVPLGGDQEPAINAIKCAALMCKHPLAEFLTKIKKYEASLGLGPSRGKISNLETKIRWGLSKKDEALKLRNYLNIHIGSINMMLMAHGLEMLTMAADQSAQDRNDLVKRIEETQSALLQSQQLFLSQFSQTLNINIASQLNSFLDLANHILQSNLQIQDIVLHTQTRLPPPDHRFTWFQEPVKFEDALGRVLPIPSEYNYGMVTAIIRDQFRSGPGHRLVLAKQYELFDVRNAASSITNEQWAGFLPGAHIKMAAIVGQEFNSQERCPMPQCVSETFSAAMGGGYTWYAQFQRRPSVQTRNFLWSTNFGFSSRCRVWFVEPTRKAKAVASPVPDGDQAPLGQLRIDTEQIFDNQDGSNDHLVDEDIALFRNVRVCVRAKKTHPPPPPTVEDLSFFNTTNPDFDEEYSKVSYTTYATSAILYACLAPGCAEIYTRDNLDFHRRKFHHGGLCVEVV